jgi:hypothetical protein
MEGHALHQPGTDPFGRYQNSSGIVDTAKRSEGLKHAEGQYLLPSEGFCVFFCGNWFLMLIGSEAVRGHSRDPSRTEPCWADPIQCMPSFTVKVLGEIIYYILKHVLMFVFCRD